MGIYCGWTSRLCLSLHRAAHWFSSNQLRYVGMFFKLVNRVLTGADIDIEAEVSASTIIPHTIGSVIGSSAIVEGAVTLMPHVVPGALNSDAKSRRHPHVQAGAVIGTGAKLTGPITIGEKAKIGANPVVLFDVPTGATVVGIPGKIVSPEGTHDKIILLQG